MTDIKSRIAAIRCVTNLSNPPNAGIGKQNRPETVVIRTLYPLHQFVALGQTTYYQQELIPNPSSISHDLELFDICQRLAGHLPSAVLGSQRRFSWNLDELVGAAFSQTFHQ